MKKQDTDSEDPQPEVTQSSEEAPSAEGATETCAAAKDSVESGSPKESEPATPQTDTPPHSDTPPQSDEAGGGVAGAAKCRSEIVDELSRQLEDILSTYCRESMSDDNSTQDCGQSHSPEFNGLARGDKKPEEGKANGEKQQRKTQGKKKVKGLGKEITVLMQTLNTLSTPDEKLAGLCKKYAELLGVHRDTQKQVRALQKKQNEVVQEKDTLRNEHSKAILARSKLESLCKELQKHNRSLKEDGVQRARLEEEKRKEVTSHFQLTLNDIQVQMEQHNERNASLRQDNAELADKLKTLYDQYKLREEHIDKAVKHKDLQQQLVDAKLHQAQELLNESEERHEREKEFLLKETVESLRMCKLMTQQEVHLKQQVSLYSDKFEECHSTLSKSNEVFTTFKQEMEKMTKKIKKLEKETAMYRSRWESSNKALVEMAEEKTVRDQEFEALQGKVQRLDKLRRALKAERNKLSKKVQSLSDDQGGGGGGTENPDPDTDSSSPPPTDSLAGEPSVPAPESDSAPPSQPQQGASAADTDSTLEGAAAPAPQK